MLSFGVQTFNYLMLLKSLLLDHSASEVDQSMSEHGTLPKRIDIECVDVIY